MHEVSRRSFLAASALAGAAFAAPANAAVPFAGVQGPGVYRFKLGDFQISAIFDGVWYLPIDDKLVRNASGPDVNQALAAAFLPPNILPISFTALLVNTGAKVILIDTGTAGQVADTAGSLLDNLYVAGTDPKAIDTIPDLAFSSGSHRRPQDHRRRQGFSECGDSRAGARMGLLDERHQHGSGAGRGETLLPQCPAHLQGHRRRSATLRSGRGGRAGNCFGACLWPHARPHSFRYQFR
jgi:hypothetical protein